MLKCECGDTYNKWKHGTHNVRVLAFSAAARAVARNDTKLARTLLTHDVTVRLFLAVADRTVDSSSLAPLPRKGVNHEKAYYYNDYDNRRNKIDNHNELSHPIRPYQYSVKQNSGRHSSAPCLWMCPCWKRMVLPSSLSSVS